MNYSSPTHRLTKLFLSTLYLSAFTFGGGYVIVSLLKTKFVDELHWIREEEMLDLVAIAQSAPGPIAVNGAIVIGYQIAGLPGILAAVIGAVLPPFVIISLISLVYQVFRTNLYVQSLLDGMTAGVSAVILSVVLDMFLGLSEEHDKWLYVIMAAAFIANYFLRINVIYIILACIVIGIVRTMLAECKKGGSL